MRPRETVKTPSLLPAPRAQLYLALLQMGDDVPRILAGKGGKQGGARLREWAAKVLMMSELLVVEGGGGAGRIAGDLRVVALLLDGILLTWRAEQESQRQGEPLLLAAGQLALWAEVAPRLQRAMELAREWALEARA